MKKTVRKSKNVIDMRPGMHTKAMQAKRKKHVRDNRNSPNKPASPMPRPRTKQKKLDAAMKKKLDAARKKAIKKTGWKRGGVTRKKK